MTIWKYTLNPGRTILEIPAGGQVLAAQVQHARLQLWVLVDPTAPLAVREFTVYGTGHPVTEDPGRQRTYIGTVQMSGGNLVIHVFETTGK